MRKVPLRYFLLWLALLPVALALATQYLAASLAYQAQLGPPIVVIAGLPLYPPWAFFGWAHRYWAYAPALFSRAEAILYIGAGVAFMLTILPPLLRKGAKALDAHGSARWATTDELARKGLLGDAGVVLCQTSEARFSSRMQPRVGADGRKELGEAWSMRRAGRLLRHNGPEHVFVFAPTGTGKGIAIVVPSLVGWTGSVLVNDIKRELWALTSGFRSSFSRCWRFEPTAADSVRFNPIFEIRPGLSEVKDTQNVADLLIDPSGAKERSHWDKSAHRLLVGAILHVLYAEAEKSLTGVLRFLTDPRRTQFDTFQLMLATQHLPSGPHPTVAGVAREMLNKAEKELSSIVSTAVASLGLYDDPIIARNTAESDFRISDLMNADRPVSLYMVYPPSDIVRITPLIRLVLNQICRRLTESMEFGDKAAAKHRLLMLLDEFPSLGRLDFFESALAFVRGYGIKCLLIAQSLNQLEKAYGPKNSILDNCGIRIAFTANDEQTANRIADLLGQSTQVKRQLSFSGNRMAPWLSKVSQAEQEYARPLLTAGEVLGLPFDQALVLVSGMPPYRARKVMYYLDDRLNTRTWRPGKKGQPAQWPPLDNANAQAAELLPARKPEWFSLPQPPAPSSGGAAPAASSVSHAKTETEAQPISDVKGDVPPQIAAPVQPETPMADHATKDASGAAADEMPDFMAQFLNPGPPAGSNAGATE